MRATQPTKTITRRRLLAASGAGLAGGSAIVATACGTKEAEPSSERDVELLTAMLTAEANVRDAYAAAQTELSGEELAAARAFEAQTEQQVDRLARAIESAGGSPAEGEAGKPAGDGSPLEAPATALEAAIAACREAAGRLSTEDLRRTALGVAATDAGQLAAVRDLLGDEPVPRAFVTGLAEPPAGEES